MNIFTTYILVCLTILVCSCSSTVNTYEPAEEFAKPQYIADKRIITDSSLKDCAKVVAINQAYVDGLLKIQVRLANVSSEVCSVNYQFSWVDANGMQVGTSTSKWETVVLEGGEHKFISAVAPSVAAVDFTLKFLADVREY